MDRDSRLPAETESDLVVAIFRTILIVIIAFSPAIMLQTRATVYLQVTLSLAGIYNLCLLIVYWRGLRFSYQRQITISIDLLLITLWIYYSGSLGVHFFPFYYITVIVAGFWFGVTGTLTSAAVAGILYLAVVYSLPGEPYTNRFFAVALHEQIPFLFLVALVISYISDIQTKQRRAWYEARIFLARHQERIRLAQKVYDLLQPGGLPVLPGLDLGLRFRPAGTAVAGDYYEIIPFSDTKVGIAVADVAGKLEPGLVKLPIFKSTLRVAARTGNTPLQLLEETNRVLYPELQPEMFISLSYGIIDLKQMIFTCAVAGQEPPFLIRGADRQIADIPASGIVLGVLPDVVYEEHTVQLSPGDTLVFFTDGVVEIQNQDGEEFGSSRLCRAAGATDARDLTAQDLANRLMELIIGFSSPYGRKDDMTILVVKIPPPPAADKEAV